jgi:hypothetical protein
MLEECMPNAFGLIKRKKRYTLKNGTKYIIPLGVIKVTETVLGQYGRFSPPNEGLVYWGGTQNGDSVRVQAVIAPKTNSSYGRVSTTHRSNVDFVECLNRRSLIEIAQVHSHPTGWVDHSNGDDDWAAFKIEGLLSIVVPEYGLKGMLPITICGIHIYIQDRFVRLSNKYVNQHFLIDNHAKCFSEDLR